MQAETNILEDLKQQQQKESDKRTKSLNPNSISQLKSSEPKNYMLPKFTPKKVQKKGGGLNLLKKKKSKEYNENVNLCTGKKKVKLIIDFFEVKGHNPSKSEQSDPKNKYLNSDFISKKEISTRSVVEIQNSLDEKAKKGFVVRKVSAPNLEPQLD